MFHHKLFSDASFGGDTKSFTSCDFTHINTPLVTDSFCFSCPFSSSVTPNCSNQFATAPQTLSSFTERIIRNKSSVFEASALKCMVCLPFFFFQNSTTQSTNALEHWMTCIFESFYHLSGCRISFSFRSVRKKSSLPLLFISRTAERPVSLRESLRVILDFFLNSKYKFHHVLLLSNRCR